MAEQLMAFPSEQHETQDGTWNQTFDPGMTLRDWFAGQALISMSAFGPKGHAPAYVVAGAAYAYADAMLAARTTTPEANS